MARPKSLRPGHGVRCQKEPALLNTRIERNEAMEQLLKWAAECRKAADVYRAKALRDPKGAGTYNAKARASEERAAQYESKAKVLA